VDTRKMEGFLEYIRHHEAENSVIIFIINDDNPSETVQINKGVRKGRGLSPVLFNVCVNKILQEFKMTINKVTQLTNSLTGR
jgi:hypothetical protein